MKEALQHASRNLLHRQLWATSFWHDASITKWEVETTTLGENELPPRVETWNIMKRRYAFLFGTLQQAFASLQQSTPSRQHF